MKYKMMCCDIDGTLLRNDKTISKDVKCAIASIQAKNIPFTLVSGRSYEGVKKVWRMLQTSGYSVCYNGNLVCDKDTILFDNGFSIYEFKEVLSILSKYRIEGFLCTKEHEYIAESLYGTIIHDESEWIQAPILLKDNQYDVVMTSTETFYKMSLHIKDKQIYQKLLNDCNHLPITFVQAEDTYYDLMMRGHQKVDGIKMLMQYLKIEREKLICIGDNENDISMISYAGIGIAVENASENVKKHADFVGESNENDGVAKIIEAFLM